VQPTILGKTAVVFGAAGGIGVSVARKLHADGFSLALADRDSVKLDAIGNELRGSSAGQTVFSSPVEATVEESVQAFANAVVEQLGTPDVLVSLTGIQGRTAPIWELDAEEWNELFAANVNSVHLLCRAFLEKMVSAKRGTVILMSSQRGKDGVPGLAHYAGSKGAIIAIGKSLAKELAPSGLAVHTVTPGPIEAGMGAGQGAPSPEVIAKLNIPMGRFGTPDEVAELVSVLASGRLSFSTGYTWDMSGGKAVS